MKKEAWMSNHGGSMGYGATPLHWAAWGFAAPLLQARAPRDQSACPEILGIRINLSLAIELHVLFTPLALLFW